MKTLLLVMALCLGKDPEQCKMTMHMKFMGEWTVKTSVVECEECYKKAGKKHKSKLGEYWYSCEKVSS